MRLKVIKSKNVQLLYIIETIYVDGKQKTRTVEKLGRYSNLKKELNGADPITWAKEYIAELNQQQKENTREVIIKRKQSELIYKGTQYSFNGGYLFLQQLYHQLGLHKICRDISEKYKFTYDLNSILNCPDINTISITLIGNGRIQKPVTKNDFSVF